MKHGRLEVALGARGDAAPAIVREIVRNALYFGDNEDVLARYVGDASVDLIYLDPPFNSNQDYDTFEDRWNWDAGAVASYERAITAGGRASAVLEAFFMQLGAGTMLAYLAMMVPRLEHLRRVLKPAGSLYLHCDPTSSHYLKVLTDALFGPENFRSEIVWRRSNAHNKLTSQYGPIHDTILFYSKSRDFTFHPGVRPYAKAYIEDRFVASDAAGRYQLNYLTGPGTRAGESGKVWRDFDPTAAGRHWAIPRSLRRFIPNDGAGMSSHQQLDALFDGGYVVFPKKPRGQPMYKHYVGPGVPYQDIWAYQPNTRGVLWGSDACIDEDVKYLEDEDERIGYPTQKPLGLLKRIVETSSDPDDVVLDPFAGCGTSVDAAQAMGRRWIAIDSAPVSIATIEHRLKARHDLEPGRDYVRA
ncbi:MAG TPA: site-specific DNA-methyltransferase [Candidatus Elarobacter sp.]|jgi:site-specific DNA-methyltransferase (adenine-specific)